LDSAVVGAGVGSGSQEALTQLYHAASVDDGYRVRQAPAPAPVPDFQPPYFPPPYTLPQPSTGASSAVVEFTPGVAGQPPTPRLFSANMYGYTAGVQSAAAPPHYGLIPPSSSVDQGDYDVAAASVGGGAVYGMASPRRATGGGGEYRMNGGTATTVLQATSALPDFPNLDNLTFTQACLR